ncbi:MAG: hypothetical protein E7607_05455 [Ruminococcaceae bacterium]|nr:hypothetical protein [Oscillospiraceae bacterium]
MAVIGGIFDMDGELPSSSVMTQMSNAMLVRGGYGRGGYINRGIGLFSGWGIADRERDRLFFASAERGGENIVAVSDGEAGSKELGLWDSYSEKNATVSERIIERYMSFGARLGESMEGDFSAALYDGGRSELLLIRDRRGSRPLFYAKDKNKIAFASEIKGIARFVGCPLAVNVKHLNEHFFSAAPRSGIQIYRDIFEVPPSGGCICSALGVNRFNYVPSVSSAVPSSPFEVLEGDTACPTAFELERMLTDILFAFDYPQFDYLMPSFIRGLSLAKGKIDPCGVAISDGSLYMDLAYSTERRDRLCSYYGVYAECVPSEYEIRERELKQLEKALLQLLSGIDMSLCYRLFGKDVHELIAKEKSVPRRIRMEGMLYQAYLWNKHYSLIFI